jgi:hypothetical protein
MGCGGWRMKMYGTGRRIGVTFDALLFRRDATQCLWPIRSPLEVGPCYGCRLLLRGPSPWIPGNTSPCVTATRGEPDHQKNAAEKKPELRNHVEHAAVLCQMGTVLPRIRCRTSGRAASISWLSISHRARYGPVRSNRRFGRSVRRGPVAAASGAGH